MLVHKAYKFRIYPNTVQQTLIVKTINCIRFVFNHFLSEWNNTYAITGKGLTYSTYSSQLPNLKKEYEWLKEVDSIAVQTSVKNLSESFSRFFKKQNKFPRFQSKKNPVQSYTTKQTNGNINVFDNTIKLPKLGLVKFAKSREVEGRILSATIKRNPTGKYFVSLLVETEVEELPKTGSALGVYVGSKDFVILSDETVYKNPRFLRTMEKKLADAYPGACPRDASVCSANHFQYSELIFI